MPRAMSDKIRNFLLQLFKIYSKNTSMNFYQYSSKPLNNLELELTSKCALKCLRCARTLQKGTYNITELPLNIIKKRLHSDILKGLNSITLSGNYGDPIYHKHLPDILKYLKSQNCKIDMETNGSGKKTNFWKEITSILDSKDSITFSVDGLKDTNHIYRINSKWDSIQQAMEIVSKSKVQTDWKFIVFKHNQHQIEKAQQFAKSLGIFHFIIVKSSLFGETFKNKEGLDPLKPSAKWIKSSPASCHSNNQKVIYPQCLIKNLHYISAEAYYFPCCWVGHYHIVKSVFSEQEMKFLSLYNHSLKEILQSETLKKLEKSWKDALLAPKECIKYCGDKKASQNKSKSFYEKTYYDLRQ